jgi:1,2-diacylglycerol 3-beta-glucosyltransferase
VLAFTFYLFVLTIFAGPRSSRSFRPPRTRFDIIVPAHNEESGIANTIASLRALDYPRELTRILVVADNCTDATAHNARGAGATVLERTNSELRGKGYALSYAFDVSARDKMADAVVVIDADTVASPNLLRAFATRFEEDDAHAVQAEYGVANPEASWRTRLMKIAFALFHTLRSNARERLGLSSGLRGNGMGFSHTLLAKFPHDAYSVVEDVEYGIRLGKGGRRVHYVGEAHVLGEMAASEKASVSQRRRWEGGRLGLLRQHAWPLLRAGLGGDRVQLDLACDLLVPPLTYIVALSAIGSVASIALSVHLGRSSLSLYLWLLSCAFLAAYLVRGIVLSGVGIRGATALLWAPFYMLWKIGLLLRKSKHKKGEWVRTMRDEETR